ncbi:MAG: hypothetical protein VX601_11705 [Pseudomonadota bacterium]|nr:hypothetical protein [Pseudomonadota bacterium]
MTTSTPRVLIAENQYLIAMEVERILQESLTCDVMITPLSRLTQELSAGNFEIVIIDAAAAEPLNVERAKLIQSAGAMPVFLSSYDSYPVADTVVSSYPKVSKPPQSAELAAAVLDAMRRKSSDSEGLLYDR